MPPWATPGRGSGFLDPATRSVGQSQAPVTLSRGTRATASSSRVPGASANLVQGNLIGTDATGMSRLGNAIDGIVLLGSNNTIGGTVAGARNVVSANALGILIGTADASSNVVQGNYVGTDATGAQSLSNNGAGIEIDDGGQNTIGGTSSGGGNVVSGNGDTGIDISAGTGNLVVGNLVGTAADGLTSVGNHGAGIAIGAASNNTIGGTVAGAANTIAFNSGAGVAVSGGLRDLISANPIHDNGGPGIDLGDAKLGSNLLQHFPEITSAVNVGGATIIRSTLDSVASRSFTLEWFASAIADHAGFGQGASFLGTTTVVTDASGHASFLKVLPFAVPLGHVLSATAIDQDGNTSGFSLAATVKGPALVQWSVSGLAVDENAGTATLLVTRTGNPDVPVTVHVATAGGDAQPGINYTPVDTVLTFPPGVLTPNALDHRPR